MHRPIFITHPTNPKDRRIAFHDRMIWQCDFGRILWLLLFLLLGLLLVNDTCKAGKAGKVGPLLKWYLFSTSEAASKHPESPGHSHEVPTVILVKRLSISYWFPHVFQRHFTCWTFPPSFNVSLKKKTSPQGPRVDTCTQPTGLRDLKISSRWYPQQLQVVFSPGDSGSRPRSRLRPRPPRLGWLEVEAQRKQRPRLPGPPNYHSQRSQGLSHPPTKRQQTREATNSCLVYLLALIDPKKSPEGYDSFEGLQ